MRVLYYSRLINSSAGAGVHGREFIRGIQELGVQIDTYPAITNSKVESTVSKARTLTKKFPPTLTETSIYLRSLISSFIRARFVSNLCLRGRYDVILMRLQDMDWTCKIVSKIFGIPLALEINSPISYEIGQLYGNGIFNLYSHFEQNMWRSATCIFTISSVLKDFIISNGIPKNFVIVNPNGVNTDQFSPEVSGENVRNELNLFDKFVVTFSGTLMPWHDLESIVDILSENNSLFHLIVIGSSPHLNTVKMKARNYGLLDDIHFLGQIDHQRVPEYLAASDILVATYYPHPFFYFSPLKIIEYMAMGKPIIGSSLGQIKELLSDNCGILVEPGNKSEIVSAIKLLANDPKRASFIGENAFNRVNKSYTWKQNASRVVDALADII